MRNIRNRIGNQGSVMAVGSYLRLAQGLHIGFRASTREDFVVADEAVDDRVFAAYHFTQAFICFICTKPLYRRT